MPGPRSPLTCIAIFLCGSCTACPRLLVPLLAALWKDRHLLKLLPTLILAVFSVVMLLVNSWITAMGMGVQFGWLDHLLLMAAHISVLLFFLLEPQPTPSERIS